MPILTSYVMSGTAYDTDGTSLLTSGFATFYNINKKRFNKGGPVVVTNGSWELNANNISGAGYDNGDKIHIAVFDADGRKVGWLRHTINTAIGDFTDQSIYLKDESPYFGTVRATCLAVSNNTGSAVTADFYDNYFGNRVARLKIPANDQRDIPYGGVGKIFHGGICVVLSDATADGVTYTINANEPEEQRYG